MPSITRRTDKGLPQYRDREESDILFYLKKRIWFRFLSMTKTAKLGSMNSTATATASNATGTQLALLRKDILWTST